MHDVRGRTIFVGLSGGVDSAVSAALLQKAGAKVTGVFIKGWYPEGMPCTWAADRRDAMRVAAHLHIPFRTLDAESEYKQSVIEYLLREYAAGRTPNPDIMCNREVKFGAFYRYAMQEGADAIATGHYVSGAKDQRYFLWAVPKDVLRATVFPLSGLEKPAVRALARANGLPVSEKPDSQGICFLGDVSVDAFLAETYAPERGVAHDAEGNKIGTHGGALRYTLGERVSLQEATPGPWFVLAKDIEQNTLTVSRTRALMSFEAYARLSFTEPEWHLDSATATCAQYRYRGPCISGRIEGHAFVPTQTLSEPVAAGQSLVFYDAHGAMVGGALISSTAQEHTSIPREVIV